MNLLRERFGKRLKRDEPMRLHTTFKIGGPAKYFLEAKSGEELIETIGLAREEKIKYIVIGNGSNLLVSDEGFGGLVIKVSNIECRMVAGERMRENGIWRMEYGKLLVGAGLSLPRLSKFAMENGLTGLEWASGVPGTVGGAIVMNAGCFRKEMSDLVAKVSYFDVKEIKGARIKALTNKRCKFGYRESVFRGHPEWIILEAELHLLRGDKGEIKKKMLEYLKYRKEKLPLELPSAGSIFKRYEIKRGEKLKPELKQMIKFEHPEFLKDKYIPAGWLIEKVNFKGKKIGRALVSERHGNFILNTGGATATEVKKIIDLVKKEVRNNFGLTLEEEIIYLGF